MVMLQKIDGWVEVGRSFPKQNQINVAQRQYLYRPAKFPCTHVGEDIYSRSVWPKSQLGIWLFIQE